MASTSLGLRPQRPAKRGLNHPASVMPCLQGISSTTPGHGWSRGQGQECDVGPHGAQGRAAPAQFLEGQREPGGGDARHLARLLDVGVGSAMRATSTVRARVKSDPVHGGRVGASCAMDRRVKRHRVCRSPLVFHPVLLPVGPLAPLWLQRPAAWSARKGQRSDLLASSGVADGTGLGLSD